MSSRRIYKTASACGTCSNHCMSFPFTASYHGIHFVRVNLTRIPSIFGTVAVCLLSACATKKEEPTEEKLPPSSQRTFAERVSMPDYTQSAAENGQGIVGNVFQTGKNAQKSPYSTQSFLGGRSAAVGDRAFSTKKSPHQETSFTTGEAHTKTANVETDTVIPNIDARPGDRTYATSTATADGQVFGESRREAPSREAVVVGASQEDLDNRSPQRDPLSVEDVREILNRNR